MIERKKEQKKKNDMLFICDVLDGNEEKRSFVFVF
jgi:hypothetical protein